MKLYSPPPNSVSSLSNNLSTGLFLFHISPAPFSAHLKFSSASSSSSSSNFYSTSRRKNRGDFFSNCTSRSKDVELESTSSSGSNDKSSSSFTVDQEIDCVGPGLDVECLLSSSAPSSETNGTLLSSMGTVVEEGEEGSESKLVKMLVETGVLVSPFFFWGTAMVAMKEVLPLTGPFFVASFRLIPAGLLLVAFAAYKGRPLPSGLTAWLSITLFGLVDAACFQGFLAEGLQRTSAGLGSVIIDSQPLTVAVLAALLFGESIGFIGAGGLVLGVMGLLLLEVPALSMDQSNFSLWGSGEWWMLLAAQSMAVGTVMVRWVTKYSDPVMATGWDRPRFGTRTKLVVFSFSKGGITASP